MRGQDSMHNYPRFLQAAIQTLKDLTYDASGVPSVATLTVENTRVELPQDFVKAIRLGIVDKAGRLVEIYLDKRMAVGAQGTYSSANPNQAVTSQEVGTFLNPTVSDVNATMRNGQELGRQYGNEGGSVFSYNIDYNKGIIELSSNISGQVVLEYLADPTRINGEYQVHPFLEDALQAGMHYRYMKFKTSVPAGEKKFAETDYLNKKHHLKLRLASEGMGSMINNSRKTFSQVPKY